MEYSKDRFDWITVIDADNEEKIVCQLSGLWEFRRRKSEHRQEKSVLYFSCIPTEKYRPRSACTFETFSKIKYDLYGKGRDLRLVLWNNIRV